MWVKRKRQSALVIDQSATVSRFSYRWIRSTTIIITVLRPAKPFSVVSLLIVVYSAFGIRADRYLPIISHTPTTPPVEDHWTCT
ncbi:unnamed protein product [Aphis gossypii]|uniref:Uncharacterized protein n=1 Tax=Aphis gossypii TaxID=80765 RepID=A0A9P0NEJ0_APHGO|nr:unnamed protein product [Aphis gossypii]